MSDIARALSWARNELISYPVWASTAIAAVVAQGTTLSWWSLSATQTGEVTALVMAVLGVTAAVLTDKVGLAVIVTALQAVAALSIGFTYQGSSQAALYIGAVVAALGWFGHTMNSPAYGSRGAKTKAKATLNAAFAQAHAAATSNPSAVTVTALSVPSPLVTTTTAPVPAQTPAPQPATVAPEPQPAPEPTVEGP